RRLPAPQAPRRRRARPDPHRARRRLRPARAVTLRRRIAGTASLAVALVVLIVAIGVYVAVRSELRGEVDNALRDRARPVAEFAHGGPAGTPEIVARRPP